MLMSDFEPNKEEEEKSLNVQHDFNIFYVELCQLESGKII